MTQRLTAEREKEIRGFVSSDKCAWPGPIIKELLTEIDALRAERDGLYADLTGQEHRLGSRAEILENKLREALSRSTEAGCALIQARDEKIRACQAAIVELQRENFILKQESSFAVVAPNLCRERDQLRELLEKAHDALLNADRYFDARAGVNACNVDLCEKTAAYAVNEACAFIEDWKKSKT